MLRVNGLLRSRRPTATPSIHSLTATKAKYWKHRSESGASALSSVQMASHPAECRGVMHHCQSLSVRLCGVGVSGVRLDEAGCVTTCKLQGPWCPLPAVVSTRAAQRRDGGRTRGRPPASNHPSRRADAGVVCVPCRSFFSSVLQQVPSVVVDRCSCLPKEPEPARSDGVDQAQARTCVEDWLHRRPISRCLAAAIHRWMPDEAGMDVVSAGPGRPQSTVRRLCAGSGRLFASEGRPWHQGPPQRRRHQRTPAAIPMWDGHDRIG